MKCYYHLTEGAVAQCTNCGKFLCKTCVDNNIINDKVIVCEQCMDSSNKEKASKDKKYIGNSLLLFFVGFFLIVAVFGSFLDTGDFDNRTK